MNAILISRPEPTDLLGQNRLHGWDAHVLHRGAEAALEATDAVWARDKFRAVFDTSDTAKAQSTDGPWPAP